MNQDLGSLITLKSIGLSAIQDLLSQAHAIKAHFKEKGEVQSLYEGLSVPKVAALCFFEASTRTRFSFEAAAFRLGLQTMTLSDVASSSQSKGETYSDTLSTIAAMQPDVIVCRSTDEVDMAKHSERLGCPFVNAGRGQFEHPTQALLDMMTIQESFSQTAGLKFVFVGDVAHSRVAASNLFLLQSMGVEVAICAPRGFLPAGEAWSQLKKFETVHEAADWADVVMALRIQLERGADPMTADELSKFQIGPEALSRLSAGAIIMHPGPFNRGVEITDEVLEDSRCRIWTQKENGLYLRIAVLARSLGLKWKGQ